MVVGAGLIGLATARAILRRHAGIRLAVLEKEDRVAAHQSGHNSGVIHSGIYYQPGSLKARLCIEGVGMLRQFCDQHGIPYRRCGKLIVAVKQSELSRLQELKRRGDANGVPDLRIVDEAGIRDIEPAAVGLRAIYSPTTSIVDFRLIATALAQEVSTAGGAVLTGWPVTAIERTGKAWQLESQARVVQARSIVSCAGLYSDRLASMTGGASQPRIVPFRGEYSRLATGASARIRGLIYPVPDPAFPFLGVHFTPRMNGDVWVGPNALVGLAREGYRRTSVNLGELASMLRWPGFYRLGRRYWRMGMNEFGLAFRRRAFLSELRRYVPTIAPGDLGPGPTGVRAQAVDSDGRLLDDFAFSEDENVLHVRNAPSPGATACLAIAETIVDRLQVIAQLK